MQFPVFHVPLVGDGTIIGVNAVIHVVLSHGLAIGAFAILVASAGHRLPADAGRRDQLDRFHDQLLFVLVVAITVLGAVTGVGIWMTTTALAPHGIASMLRIFFWPWFIEYGVFVAEVAAILLLYKFWPRLDTRRRRLYGWLYVASAAASAVLITGIIAFMLTPGGWPWERRFSLAFFNPSFASQGGLRLALGGLLGAVAVALFTLARRPPPPVLARLLRLCGWTAAGSLLILVLMALLWWWQIPTVFQQWAAFSVLTSHLAPHPWVLPLVNGLAVLAIAAFGARAIAGPGRRGMALLTVLAAVFAIGWAAQFERAREFQRKPYLIPGYMSPNGVLVQEEAWLDTHGHTYATLWAAARLASAPDDPATSVGVLLFERHCGVCHTRDGVNAISRHVRGRSEPGLRVIIDHLPEIVPFMPPFSGSEIERHLLVRYLHTLGAPR